MTRWRAFFIHIPMLLKRVKLFFEQMAGFGAADCLTLVVGVSDGPDSLALLHVLTRIFPSERLVVGHVEHGLRETAVSDAILVENRATQWGVACTVKHVDVSEIAAKNSWSLEEAGRNVRYRFFAELAARVGATAVAVAHHADDQAETVLLHLLRGSGLVGLRGMLPIAPMLGAMDVRLIRPLLHIQRTEILDYCKKHDIQPIQDASNADTTFLRNRIRHDLLPQLREYNPQIKRNLQQLADVVAADEDVLANMSANKWPKLVVHQGNGWVQLKRGMFVTLPKSLQRRLLRRAVQLLLPDLRDMTFASIEKARLLAAQPATGAWIPLPRGVIFAVGYDLLTIKLNLTAVPLNYPQLKHTISLPLTIPGSVALGDGWELQAEVVQRTGLGKIETNQDVWQAFVDVGDLSALQIRRRLPGERFQPLGMAGSSAKLKDVMINRKLAIVARESWPLVCSENHLIWFVGHQIDERVRVTAVSKEVVRLRCLRIERGRGSTLIEPCKSSTSTL